MMCLFLYYFVVIITNQKLGISALRIIGHQHLFSQNPLGNQSIYLIPIGTVFAVSIITSRHKIHSDKLRFLNSSLLFSLFKSFQPFFIGFKIITGCAIEVVIKKYSFLGFPLYYKHTLRRTRKIQFT